MVPTITPLFSPLSCIVGAKRSSDFHHKLIKNPLLSLIIERFETLSSLQVPSAARFLNTLSLLLSFVLYNKPHNVYTLWPKVCRTLYSPTRPSPKWLHMNTVHSAQRELHEDITKSWSEGTREVCKGPQFQFHQTPMGWTGTLNAPRCHLAQNQCLNLFKKSTRSCLEKRKESLLFQNKLEVIITAMGDYIWNIWSIGQHLGYIQKISVNLCTAHL